MLWEIVMCKIGSEKTRKWESTLDDVLHELRHLFAAEASFPSLRSVQLPLLLSSRFALLPTCVSYVVSGYCQVLLSPLTMAVSCRL